MDGANTELDILLTPPRRNGELVFDEPWESRTFGMALVLQDKLGYTWEEFRNRVAAHSDEDRPVEGASRYYERWLSVLETMLGEVGTVTDAELDRRASEFASGKFDHHDQPHKGG